MAGLISPKPVSYMQQHSNLQYNPYPRNVSSFSESPGAVVAPLGIHTPSQALAAFPGGSPAASISVHEEQKIYALVIDLLDPVTREAALLELSKKREQYDDLALVLWHSFGTLVLRSGTYGIWAC